MRSNPILLIGAFVAGCLLCTLLAANQAPPQTPQVGRFAIAINENVVVIVDSVTGRAWDHRFQAGNKGYSVQDFYGPKIPNLDK